MSKGKDVSDILAADVEAQYGPEAMNQNIEAVTRLSDSITTTFGPYGQDKLIVDNGGNVDVTNETAAILRALHITDPVARVLRDVANTQIFRAGDGTTAAILFLGALLDRTVDLREQGLHPASIVRGYEDAQSVAHSASTQLASKTTLGDDGAVEVARTVLSGTSAEFDKETLATLVIDAVAHVTEGTHVNLNRLRVTSTRGSEITGSELLSGAIIEAYPDTFSSDERRRAQILLVDKETAVTETTQSTSVATDSASGLQNVRQAEEDRHQRVLAHVQKLGVDVIFAKSMEGRVKSTLESAGITCVTSVPASDFGFLRETLGVKSVDTIAHAAEEHVATGDVDFHPKDNQTEISRPESGTITVKLSSTVGYHGEEVENTVKDAIEVVSQIVTDGRVLPGGGATEVELAESVRRAAAATADRSQLAMFAYADALEELPRNLARNAGLDASRLLPDLRRAHQDGAFTAGIDVESGTVRDMRETGVLDTFVVKRELLSNATQAACMISRIDGIVEQSPDETDNSASGPY